MLYKNCTDNPSFAAYPPAIPTAPPPYESVVTGPNHQQRRAAAPDTSSSPPKNHNGSTEQANYDVTQARQPTDGELYG